MRILTVPDDSSVLRQKSQLVKKIDRNLARFMREMGKTLKSQHDPEGVGLSAIQIGRPVRVFALNHKHLARGKKDRIVFYINPEIISHSEEKTLGQKLMNKPARIPSGRETLAGRPFLEGCLSVPDLYGEVSRWSTITTKAAIIKEDELTNGIFNFLRQPADSIFNLSELTARVFQHEIDHLDGILFTDHTVKDGGQLYKWDGEEMVEMKI